MNRLIVALLGLVATAGGSFAVPHPFRWQAIALATALGLRILLRPAPRDVILRYGRLTWTRWELCRHVLITGDTGSGKTTSGFQPMLDQLTRNVPDWGGLVLGVKGDEHRFIEKLTKAYGRKNDLIHLQVRPPDCSTKWRPPHRYNLLSDRSIPWSTHAKIIVDIASSLTEGSKHPFFGTMAQIAMSHAFEALDELGQPVTIPRAYELLTQQETATRAAKLLRRNGANPTHQKLAEFLESTFTKARAPEQREGIEGTIKTYLGFYMHPDVAAVFCSEGPNTFSFSHLDRGNILTVTMPQTLATERRYIQTYLKILFYLHALRRYDIAQEERDARNLLLLVADEFQDLVTASEDGFSDHKIVDRIRGAGACIIAGMQSELSVDPATSEKKRKVLALNLRTRFIFRAASLEDALISAEYVGKRLTWKQTISNRGLGPRTISRKQQEDYRLSPRKLLNLPDHKVVIVHPSKRFINMLGHNPRMTLGTARMPVFNLQLPVQRPVPAREKK